MTQPLPSSPWRSFLSLAGPRLVFLQLASAHDLAQRQGMLPLEVNAAGAHRRVEGHLPMAVGGRAVGGCGRGPVVRQTVPGGGPR